MLIYKMNIYYNNKERAVNDIFINTDNYLELDTDLNLTDIIDDYSNLNMHDMANIDLIIDYIYDDIYKESFLETVSANYRKLLKDRLSDDIKSGEIVVSVGFEILDEYSYIRTKKLTEAVKSSGKDLKEVIESDKYFGVKYITLSYDLNNDEIKYITANYEDDKFGEYYYIMDTDKIKLYNDIKPGDVLAKKDGTLDAFVVSIAENKLGNMYNNCSIRVLRIENHNKWSNTYIDEGYMIENGVYIHSHHPELLELFDNGEHFEIFEKIYKANKIKGE